MVTFVMQRRAHENVRVIAMINKHELLLVVVCHATIKWMNRYHSTMSLFEVLSILDNENQLIQTVLEELLVCTM